MLVSVIMSVYNAEDYLEEAIDSILAQTYRKFEFIIIDDGSVDGTLNIIQKYADLDSRIVLVKNEVNLGLPAALNKGIAIAKGKYIARQDADDRSTPDRLELQLKYALAHGEVDLVACDSFVIDINGDLVCENTSFSIIKDHRTSVLERNAIFSHGCAFMKKETLVKVGMYDTRFYYSQDGELWLRLLDNGAKFYTIPKSLYYYRVLPIKNTKKYNAQSDYNEVKHMIYVNNADEEAIDEKLNEIRRKIAERNTYSAVPNYMAIYWKGLANTAYFNKQIGKATHYKYLFRALKDTKSAMSYVHYFKLGMVYLLPGALTKHLLFR